MHCAHVSCECRVQVRASRLPLAKFGKVPSFFDHIDFAGACLPDFLFSSCNFASPHCINLLQHFTSSNPRSSCTYWHLIVRTQALIASTSRRRQPPPPSLTEASLSITMEVLTGSPKKKVAASFNIYEDNTADTLKVSSSSSPSTSHEVAADPPLQPALKRATSAMPMPLTTSRFANQLSRASPEAVCCLQHI